MSAGAGRLGLTIVGMAAGYIIGGPVGMSIGGMVGSFAGTMIFPIELEDVEGPRLNDLHIQASTYGAPISWVFGTVRCAGNIIWSAGLVEHAVETEVGEGKGGPSQTAINYSYTCSFAVGICRGVMDRVLKIWADGKLIYNVHGTVDVAVKAGLDFTFYSGNETQLPDPTIEAHEGVGEIPAHRGLCYIVFEDLELDNFGNRIPNLNFEVVSNAANSWPVVTLPAYTLIWGEDDFLFDVTETFLYYHSTGRHYKINVLDNTFIVNAKYYTDIPAYGSHMDVDEYGRVYTTHESTPNMAFPIRLTSEFEEDVMAGDDIWAPKWAKVSRNFAFPYVWYSALLGDDIHLYDRETMVELYSWTGYVGAPSGYEAHMGAIDDSTGCLYFVLASHYLTADQTWLVKIDPLTKLYEVWDLSAYIHDGCWINFEPANGHLFIGNMESVIVIWDTTTETVVKTITTAVTGSLEYGAFNRIQGHRMWTGTGNLSEINTLGGTVERILPESTWPTRSATLGGIIYDSISHAIWSASWGSHLDKCYLDRGTPQKVTLASIVDALCNEVALTDPEIDVSELTDLVWGYIVSSRMTARKAIEPLQVAYFFDGVESDGKIKFLKRGRTSSVTIDDDDLSVHEPTAETPDALVTTRQQELELPKILNILYMNPAEDYQQGTQSSQRLITRSEEEKTITLPIVLEDNEAKQITEKLHYMIWLERNKYRFNYSRKYFYLDPIDVITLTVGSNTYIVRLLSMNYGFSGQIDVEAVAEDSTVYSSTSIGASGEWIPPTAIPYPGPTLISLMDINYFRDNESYSTPSGFYIAASGYVESWRGCTLFRSADGGITYSVYKSITNQATMGKATTVLADIEDPTVWDTGSVVTVRLNTSGATLSNDSEINVLNGANAAVLGAEIIQFMTATLNGDGTYTLSNLLRGRRGTEHETSTHAVGETFVLLSSTTIYRVDPGTAELNQARTYRGVSYGLNFETGVSQAFTNTGKGLKPYSPVHVAGTRDGANNLTITWIRRTRVDGSWLDGADVPLGETVEDYEVDIYSDPVTVVRTIHVVTQTASYTAAQQTADGLTPGDPVHVKVYQIGSQGRGYEVDATI